MITFKFLIRRTSSIFDRLFFKHSLFLSADWLMASRVTVTQALSRRLAGLWQSQTPGLLGFLVGFLTFLVSGVGDRRKCFGILTHDLLDSGRRLDSSLSVLRHRVEHFAGREKHLVEIRPWPRITAVWVLTLGLNIQSDLGSSSNSRVCCVFRGDRRAIVFEFLRFGLLMALKKLHGSLGHCELRGVWLLFVERSLLGLVSLRESHLFLI